MICLKIDGYERQSVFTPHPKPRIVQLCAAAIRPASVRFRDTRRDRTNPLLSSLTVVKTVIDSESCETTVSFEGLVRAKAGVQEGVVGRR